jgi:hypothetical protein
MRDLIEEEVAWLGNALVFGGIPHSGQADHV